MLDGVSRNSTRTDETFHGTLGNTPDRAAAAADARDARPYDAVPKPLEKARAPLDSARGWSSEGRQDLEMGGLARDSETKGVRVMLVGVDLELLPELLRGVDGPGERSPVGRDLAPVDRDAPAEGRYDRSSLGSLAHVDRDPFLPMYMRHGTLEELK